MISLFLFIEIYVYLIMNNINSSQVSLLGDETLCLLKAKFNMDDKVKALSDYFIDKKALHEGFKGDRSLCLYTEMKFLLFVSVFLFLCLSSCPYYSDGE